MLCNVRMASKRHHHHTPEGGNMHTPKVTPAPPHRYVDSDLLPEETLVAYRLRVDAAKREQAKRTKRRVLQSLLRK